MSRIVVAGGGLAGHRAVGALRRHGFEGEVVVVGDEAHPPYDRPPLSKKMLEGASPPEACFFRSEDVEATWMLGRSIVGVDVEGSMVFLGDGGELAYDGLVVATGRRARPWPGPAPRAGVYTLRSLDDALALQQATRGARSVAIVGAGFIGCEVAATLRERGTPEVTLIDVAPRPMPALGDEIGDRAARLHAGRGVRLRLGATVAELEGEEHVRAVRLGDGERIEAEAVLIAIGSQPNSEWMLDSGLELVDGCLLCDELCVARGAANIVGAGDIAAWRHVAAGGVLRIEHWTNARDMAEAAVFNLLASPEDRVAYAPIPTFWSDQYDVKIKSAGFITLADAFSVVDEDPERPSVVVEAHRDGELVGAIAFNRNRTILEYQRALASAPTA